MTDTMKAAVLYGPSDVRFEDVPVPRVGPGDVLVRVGAALTCGTDAKVLARGGHPRMIRPPALFGHEFAGTVERVGEAVEGFEPGMRVVSANSAPCGRCFYCERGRPNLCEDLLFINGAYAEYALIPERVVRVNLHRIPDALPFEHAALVEPFACVLHGLDDAPVGRGDTVAVLGCGPVGLLFVIACRLAGATVIACDPSAERLSVAGECGAAHLVSESDPGAQRDAVQRLTPGGRGADLAIEAVGTPRTWEQAVSLARPGGTVSLFGGCAPGTSFTVDTKLLHYSELRLVGSFHHTPVTVRRALELISGGGMPAGALVRSRVPLTEVMRALANMRDHVGVKTAVVP